MIDQSRKTRTQSQIESILLNIDSIDSDVFNINHMVSIGYYKNEQEVHNLLHEQRKLIAENQSIDHFDIPANAYKEDNRWWWPKSSVRKSLKIQLDEVIRQQKIFESNKRLLDATQQVKQRNRINNGLFTNKLNCFLPDALKNDLNKLLQYKYADTNHASERDMYGVAREALSIGIRTLLKKNGEIHQ